MKCKGRADQSLCLLKGGEIVSIVVGIIASVYKCFDIILSCGSHLVNSLVLLTILNGFDCACLFVSGRIQNKLDSTLCSEVLLIVNVASFKFMGPVYNLSKCLDRLFRCKVGCLIHSQEFQSLDAFTVQKRLKNFGCLFGG